MIVCLLLSGCAAMRTGVAVLTHRPSAEASAAAAGTYRLDPEHSSVHFGVRHLGFSTFRGRFNKIEASLSFVPEAPAQSRLEVRIMSASVDTAVPEIDRLLRADLFDSDRYPEIVFTLTGAELTDEASGFLQGELGMHGRTRPIIMTARFNGGARNPLTGVPTLGFSATATLDRGDWGMGDWYPAVAHEVEIVIEAEFLLEQDE